MASKYPYILAKWKKESEFHALRARSIGGSEAAALFNANQWMTKLTVWLQKLGEVPPGIQEDNIYLHMGKVMEPVIRDRAQYWDFDNPDQDVMLDNYNKGNKLRTIVSRKNDTLLYNWSAAHCNMDGEIKPVPGEVGRGILECKNHSSWVLNPYPTKILPSDYIQLQHYLMVTGFHYGILGYLIDGNKFAYYRFDADRELHDTMRSTYTEFWDRIDTAWSLKKAAGLVSYWNLSDHLLTERQVKAKRSIKMLEPPMDGGAQELKVIRELVGTTEELNETEATDKMLDLCIEHELITSEVKELSGKRDELGAKMIRELDGAQIAKFGENNESYHGYLSYKLEGKSMRLRNGLKPPVTQ